MKIIACIDRMGGLGYRGELLFHIRKDMERFRSLTTGGIVVMGYNTYRSLPHGALPDRTNIVLSKHHSIEDEGVAVCRTKEELKQILASQQEDVWIIGGESLYKEFLPECEEIYLTRVDALKKSDRFFPCPEMVGGWGLVSKGTYSEDGLDFTFERYRNDRLVCQSEKVNV